MEPPQREPKPLVLITGASGNIGRSLAKELGEAYRVVGFDIVTPEDAGFPIIKADLTDQASVTEAFKRLRAEHGAAIASVVHLAAYYDFSGEQDPKYASVNVEGTRRLLRALQDFEVDQFLYSSTMLVHAPGRPGEAIDESQPVDPQWAYPKSKAQAEAIIAAEHGSVPYVLLRLAGVYDEKTAVPTLSQQMARIYERDFESHLYSGTVLAGQSMLHRDDMLDAIKRAVNRREALPNGTAILIGEPHAMSYDALQDEIGYLLHGAEDWPTLRLPKAVAAAGAWAQEKLEPLIPDVIDRGEKPFIKPFMVYMADDHYALDISRAADLLDWRPRHRLKDTLPDMARALKEDPAAWYKANKVNPPAFVEEAAERGENAGRLREEHAALMRREHRQNRWAHMVNAALGTWLITQPLLIDVNEPGLMWGEIACGALLIAFGLAALGTRATWARWGAAAVGAVVMALPFLFWTENGMAYVSDTLVGMLAFGLAIGTKPEPGPSDLAALRGPDIPPGWTYNPSTWSQRLPIIALAILGLYVSRYLAAYQLGHIPDVWDPFFQGSPLDPQNGTEEIITSHVSEAWPVSDAAVGAYTYALEILTGIVGSRARWRTMPWLVILFGLMIAPLGVTSIFFIIIQPIEIGTWSTIALIGAAAVIVQIPYSLDELVAACDFVRRRAKAGRNWLRVLLRGDADEGPPAAPYSEFEKGVGPFLKDMVGGGVSLPWNYALAALIGLALLFTRPLLGASGDLANADHVIGSLALTVISLAAAEVARPVRYLNVILGAALILVPFVVGNDDLIGAAARILAGAALIALSFRRGPVRARYGAWSRFIV